MAKGETGVLIGWVHSKLKSTPLEIVVNSKKEIDKSLVDLARILD